MNVPARILLPGAEGVPLKDARAYIPKSRVLRYSSSPPPANALAPTRVATIAAHVYIGQRVPWQGTVAAFIPGASKLGLPNALHLTDLTDGNGVRVWADVWLPYPEYLRQFDLHEGEMVTFVARVDRQLDGTYRLNRPSDFARASR